MFSRLSPPPKHDAHDHWETRHRGCHCIPSFIKFFRVSSRNKSLMDIDAAEIVPGKLWLGSYRAVRRHSADLCSMMGITDFVNVAREIPRYPQRVINMFMIAGIGMWNVPMHDDDDEIVESVLGAVEKLHELLQPKDSCVFIHCHMGISRAPSVVIAYLSKYQGMTTKEAYEHTRKCRPVVARRSAEFLDRLLK